MQKPKFKAGDIVKRIPIIGSSAWERHSGVPLDAEVTVKYCDEHSMSFEEAQNTWSPRNFTLVKEAPTAESKTPSDYLRQAADTLDERGKQYDASGSERSMEKTVNIFNILTGNSLTTAEGWQFMKVLKAVRLWSNIDSVHADSIIDDLGYTALLAEETLTLGGKLKHSDE